MTRAVIGVGILTVCMIMTACWSLRNSKRFDQEQFFPSKKTTMHQEKPEKDFFPSAVEKYVEPEEKIPESFHLPESSEDSVDEEEAIRKGWLWQ